VPIPANTNLIAARILRLFRTQGRQQLAGGLSLETHALRCASLAGDAGEPDALIAACLLQNYGRLILGGTHSPRPAAWQPEADRVGPDRLASWFNPEVVEPIRLKEDARRYLCWREPGYLRSLPVPVLEALPASGGIMTDGEAFEFEVNPHSSAAVRLQRYADLAQSHDPSLPGIESFEPLLLSLMRKALEERFAASAFGASPSRRLRELPPAFDVWDPLTASPAPSSFPTPQLAWCNDQ
jgi:predicted HD phosphohydrolase